MKIPAHIIQHGPVAPIDFDLLLKWSDCVQATAIAQEMFRGRGVIPDDWCLVAILKDESKYFLEPETRLTRADFDRIASFHWLRPDLVAKLNKWTSQFNTGIKEIPTPKNIGDSAISDQERSQLLKRLGGMLSQLDQAQDSLNELKNRASKPNTGDVTFEPDFGDGLQLSKEEAIQRGFSWTESFLGLTITGYSSGMTFVEIPASIVGRPVVGIGEYAFKLNQKIYSVNIPDSVTTIERSAFFLCKNLTSVNLPQGVSAIEKTTFAQCESLASVSIPEGVRTIGDEAFYDCRSLARVRIPDSVTSIGVKSFAFCDSLTSVRLPERRIKLGKDAFYKCPWQPTFDFRSLRYR